MDALGNRFNKLADYSGLIKSSPKSNEKLKHNKNVKLSDSDNLKLENIMIALGTDNPAKAFRWIINKVTEDYEKEIEEIVEEKKKIRKL